jgi:hypothetical protein
MLRSGRKADEKFKAGLKVLGENVRHHVQEEESKIFSLAHEMMDDEELEERGEEWEKTKKRVMARAGNGARKSSPARKIPVNGSIFLPAVALRQPRTFHEPRH